MATRMRDMGAKTVTTRLYKTTDVYNTINVGRVTEDRDMNEWINLLKPSGNFTYDQV
jgi:hypothetical protein